jgi:nucleotide-binding universal stress UspA family protein
MTVVLTPIDGSARALHAVPWAARLAGPGGKVVLLRVVPSQPAYAETLVTLAGGGEDGVKRIQDAWTATANADLDEAAQLATGSDATVERSVVAGEPDEEIVAGAGRLGADMIAMASHGRGAIGRAIFGSVADRVARASTVPVLLLRAPDDVPPDNRVQLARIVVPLDGSPLAEQALPIARDIASRLQVPVHVVRAVDPATAIPVAPGVFGLSPAVNAEVADEIWQQSEAEADKTVADAVARLAAEGVAASGARLNGSPFYAISEATKPGDLLILTSHGRGGVRRWLLGSVAEKLVREAPVPVILVPAAGRGAEAGGGRREAGGRR